MFNEEQIDYIVNWLTNYITLYVIHGEDEAYKMVRDFESVLKGEKKDYRKGINKERKC